MAEVTSVKLRFVGTPAIDTPVAVNCSAVHVAQGTGYIDFGFMDPNIIIGLVERLKAGERPTEQVEARHLLRLAMSPEALHQLARQIDDVLSRVGFRVPEEPK